MSLGSESMVQSEGTHHANRLIERTGEEATTILGIHQQSLRIALNPDAPCSSRHAAASLPLQSTQRGRIILVVVAGRSLPAQTCPASRTPPRVLFRTVTAHRGAHTHRLDENHPQQGLSTVQSAPPLQRQSLKLLSRPTFVSHTSGNWQVPPEPCGLVPDPPVTFKSGKNYSLWPEDIQMTDFLQSKNQPVLQAAQEYLSDAPCSRK
ncbi:unnamed protein product [Pleuronectes platessa]|uniref:Uncharacterized protein n=1 Tax=Pleuronectes platessa TaxID=8262 RepID=A0A9N7YGV8_PLEPL|nr:unnamed protein product [Pleuronectes platessa]